MSEQSSTSSSADDVFINCPFDDQYKQIFDALVFTILVFAIFACEFRPRSALELDDGSQTRIDKLYDIIEDGRYGVHDLSRTELDTKNSLPRFNMPLELGVFLGAKRYGDHGQKQKRCPILDIERYRYQKFISDLSGMDIRSHSGDVDQAIAAVRDWLASVSKRDLPSAKLIQNAYAQFLSQKPAIADGFGFTPTAIPYVDYERMVTAWLLEAGPIASGGRSKPKRKKRDSGLS